MSDWTDILRERLSNASLPLPEDDWEWFEAKFRERRRRRVLLRWVSGAAAAGAAACLALVFMNKPSAEEPLAESPVSELAVASAVIPEVSVPEDEGIIPNAVRHTSRRRASDPVLLAKIPAPESETPTETPKTVTGYKSPEKPEEDKRETAGSGGETMYWVSSEAPKHKRKITVSPMGRGTFGHEYNVSYPSVFGGGGVYTGQYGGWLGGINGIENAALSHSIPLSFGLDVSVDVAPRLFMTTGVGVSYYRSRISAGKEPLTQKAYYLGVPLRLDWAFWQSGPLSAWVGTGGKVDRLVYGKYGKNRLKDNSFHWSVTGAAGLGYEISPGIGIFIEPEVSYYFKPSSPAILTYRTENPLTLTLGAGLRFSL